MKQNHSIAAIATPSGESAIALIRCSGGSVLHILSKIFRSKKKFEEIPSRAATLGWIVDPLSGEKMDHVLLTLFRAPHSYTGEDMAEITTHGGEYVLHSVFELLLKNGCAPAKPGEFTRRAFINGKVNLMQAEAVRDIVAARTSEQRRMALCQMAGESSAPVLKIKENIDHWLVKIDAAIDFPEEEHVTGITVDELKKDLARYIAEAAALLESYDSAKKIRSGLLVTIVGRPKAGKSSLFNWFCKSERVIVDPEPGTTRDAVEEELEVEGFRVRLVDTAGIRQAENRIEGKGIEKTMEYLAKADIIIWIFDMTRKEDGEEKKILEKFSAIPVLLVNNKMDIAVLPVTNGGFAVSIRNNTGLTEFLEAFKNMVRKTIGKTPSAAICSLYQHTCMTDAHGKMITLQNALDGNKKLGEEIIAEELRDIQEALEPMFGRIESAEILDRIFGEFCIGK